jgi:hypothetical protein
MSARLAAAALAVLIAALAGCATATSPPVAASARAPVASSSDSAQLCALDALRWVNGFVPRATSSECVTILDTVKIGRD